MNELNEQLVGQRIVIARKELNMSQKEVANKIGIAVSSLCRYEQGKVRYMSLPALENIAKLLDVNPVWLMGLDAPMKITETPEQKIMKLFASLNKDGKEKVLEYAEILLKGGY